MHTTKAWDDIREYNDYAWRERQAWLQGTLGALPAGDALEFLLLLHKENGFIEDDLSESRHFTCADDSRPPSAWRFVLQFNPRRAGRSTAGRLGRCVLDVEDLRRQQRGLQHYHPLALNGRVYNALPTPFPFAPMHTSIAAALHEPQSWNLGELGELRSRVKRIVSDLYALVSRLPGWYVGYNGAGAGSTVLDHLHFHVFRLPEGIGILPLQAVFSPVDGGPEEVRALHKDDAYPLHAFRVSGSTSFVLDAATELLISWAGINGSDASANLIGASEDGRPCLYVLPRSRVLESGPGVANRLGFMETAGFFVMSRGEDLADLQGGRMTHRRLWAALRAVDPPAAALLRSRL